MSDATTPEPDAAAPAEPVDQPVLMHGCPFVESHGQVVIHPSRQQYADVIKALADEGYAMCVDLIGVDYLDFMQRALPAGVTAERFELVVNLLDMEHRRRIRLRVQIPESEPSIASLFDIHPGTEAMERETFDMFGIKFDGHPDPSRILMPEDWIGHPLRKDYEIGDIPVQFKGAPA